MSMRILSCCVGLAMAHSVSLPAYAKEFKLTIATGHPPAIVWVRVLRDEFIPAVNKNLEGSGHTIAWTQAYGSTVAKIGGELDAVQRGIVDLSLVGAPFHQAKLNLLNVSYYVPFSSASVKSTVETVDEMYAKVPEMAKLWDSNNAVYLAGVGVDTFNVYTTKPVKAMSDLKGMKIGGVGPNLNWLRGTGATAVVVTPNTIYNDLQTGVYEGLLVATSQATSLKVHEVAPHMLKADIQAAYWAGLVMNKSTWKSLPPQVQAAVRKAALSYRNTLINEQLRLNYDGLEVMKKGGLKVTELSRAERVAFASALPDIAGEWVKAVEERGWPGRRVLTLFMAGLREKGESPVRDWDRK